MLKYLKEAEFYITPLQNPDGYEYSRSEDRLWRKNRRLNPDGTFGVDLNRNWDEHWGMYGTSAFTVSEVYEGAAPFSEPLTRLISDWILSIPNRYAGIDFHVISVYRSLFLFLELWSEYPSELGMDQRHIPK